MWFDSCITWFGINIIRMCGILSHFFSFIVVSVASFGDIVESRISLQVIVAVNGNRYWKDEGFAEVSLYTWCWKNVLFNMGQSGA